MRLVVESQSGVIRGAVVDTAGAPVVDAFVSAARESDAAGAQKSSVQQTRWSWDERPVITATDGTFSVGGLSPGNYTVRAYRKGGGEAVAEHVAIGTTAKLQIKPTGLVEGTVRRSGGMPDDVTVSVQDLTTGFRRTERFYKTDGRYIVRDVPRGHFQIRADAEGGTKQIEIDLADSETKTGVDLELEALVTITGRIVEAGTGKPVAGVYVNASRARGGGGSFSSNPDSRNQISDDAGRFTLTNAPTGKLAIRGWPKDFQDGDYAMLAAYRTVEGAGTIDVGDVTILRKRVKQGDPVGELGISFVQQPRDTPPDKRGSRSASSIPRGPPLGSRSRSATWSPRSTARTSPARTRAIRRCGTRPREPSSCSGSRAGPR